MKTTTKLFALLLFSLVIFAGTAVADEMTSTVQLDETFKKANEWLHQNNLALTGGASKRDDLAAFKQDEILFYGEAVGNPAHSTPAQREMMAKRAAEVVAQRALVEYLEGFALVGDTCVDLAMTKSDSIRSAVQGFVKGAQIVFKEYNKETDTAVAIIKIGLHGSKGYASTFYNKMNSDPNFKKEISTDKPDFKPAPAKIEQVKIEQAKLEVPYDCLIIDATEQDFRPALINRIFTVKGDVLYDPAKVSQKVLVEQGCGEYTNSVEKAKAVLASRGAKRPLVLKAAGSLNKSDLQVNDEDAVAVFSANQKANFLSGAMVAFVLK